MTTAMSTWRISKRIDVDGYYYVIRGYCRRQAEDGGQDEYIYTPRIEAVDLGDDAFVFRTEDGDFTCPIDEHGGYAGDIRRILRIPGVCLTDSDLDPVVERINANRDAELAAERDEFLSLLPNKYKTFTFLEFTDQDPCYYSRMAIGFEGKVVYLQGGTEHIHVGLVQDSVLLAGALEGAGIEIDDGLGADNCLPDIRYFPMPDNTIEFYFLYDVYEPFLIRNGGEADIRVYAGTGEKLIRPGETVIIELGTA